MLALVGRRILVATLRSINLLLLLEKSRCQTTEYYQPGKRVGYRCDGSWRHAKSVPQRRRLPGSAYDVLTRTEFALLLLRSRTVGQEARSAKRRALLVALACLSAKGRGALEDVRCNLEACPDMQAYPDSGFPS